MKKKPHRLAAGDFAQQAGVISSSRSCVSCHVSWVQRQVPAKGVAAGQKSSSGCQVEIWLAYGFFAADTAPLQGITERCYFRADEVREKFERFGEIRDVYLPRGPTSPTIYLAQASRKKVMAVKGPRCS